MIVTKKDIKESEQCIQAWANGVIDPHKMTLPESMLKSAEYNAVFDTSESKYSLYQCSHCRMFHVEKVKKGNAS